MSNFFTYAERISLQKFLGEGLTFKEIARTLGKDPSTISREVRKHMSQVVTNIERAAEPKTCAAKVIVIASLYSIASCVRIVQSTVRISLKRSAQADLKCRMCVTDAARSVSVPL